MNATDPSKRIPKSLDTDPKAIGDYALDDVAVGLLPAVVVVVTTRVLVPPDAVVAGVTVQSLTLPLAGVAIAVGAAVVYLTPAHTTSMAWLWTMLDAIRRPDRLEHATARDRAQVRRVFPRRGVIERADGAVVGMVKVDPPAMGLATEETWSRKATAFESFLDSTVTFPLQLYSTTRAFPVDAYLDRYEQRLSDPDVEANPQLAAFIERYVEWYRAELADRQLTIRDHYAIVAVTPAAVTTDGDGVLARLSELPYLGLFLSVLVGPSRAERRARQFELLDDRVRRVESGLREIDGVTTRRLPVEEELDVLRDFWRGSDAGEAEYPTPRTTPIVGGAQ